MPGKLDIVLIKSLNLVLNMAIFERLTPNDLLGGGVKTDVSETH